MRAVTVEVWLCYGMAVMIANILLNSQLGDRVAVVDCRWAGLSPSRPAISCGCFRPESGYCSPASSHLCLAPGHAGRHCYKVYFAVLSESADNPSYCQVGWCGQLFTQLGKWWRWDIRGFCSAGPPVPGRSCSPS